VLKNTVFFDRHYVGSNIEPLLLRTRKSRTKSCRWPEVCWRRFADLQGDKSIVAAILVRTQQIYGC
jgi:hypothetical protein